jgi:NADH-ubiquinone oxidoreductase chain 3
MEFAPICVYLVINLLLSLILIGVSFLFTSSSSLAYPEKLSIYECGFDPLDDAGSRFYMQFYLVSILFIIFDLEVTFLFPWAVSLNKNGLFGFWFMIFFY